VLRNLYILGAVLAEYEAEPPLLVDADAVLSLAIPRERLNAVAGRRPQVAKIGRGVEVAQFPRATLTRSAGKPFGLSPLKTASVVLSRKLLITLHLYHLMIQMSRINVSTNDTAIGGLNRADNGEAKRRNGPSSGL